MMTTTRYLTSWRRCLSVFGHIARLTQGTPADNALHCQVGLASGRSLGRDWRRRPGRPRACWTDQLRNDTGSVHCQPLEAGHPTAPWWSDATARAGYAMTTTTTTMFTCVGWQVTLCDPIWQVTSRSSEMGFPWRAISALPSCVLVTVGSWTVTTPASPDVCHTILCRTSVQLSKLSSGVVFL